MNKSELIAEIADKMNTSNAQSAQFLGAFTEVIMETLTSGGVITLIGFLSFSVVKAAARLARNPKTGVAIKVPAKNRILFKAGKTLKDAIQ